MSQNGAATYGGATRATPFVCRSVAAVPMVYVPHTTIAPVMLIAGALLCGGNLLYAFNRKDTLGTLLNVFAIGVLGSTIEMDILWPADSATLSEIIGFLCSSCSVARWFATNRPSAFAMNAAPAAVKKILPRPSRGTPHTTSKKTEQLLEQKMSRALRREIAIGATYDNFRRGLQLFCEELDTEHPVPGFAPHIPRGQHATVRAALNIALLRRDARAVLELLQQYGVARAQELGKRW